MCSEPQGMCYIETANVCKCIIVCSEPQGMCYIETANLDGETNLKLRQVAIVATLCRL